MHTVELQLEDTMYENMLNSGIDIQEKFKEFLLEFADNGYPAISAQEANARVVESLEKYHNNPDQFSNLDDDTWNDIEKRLIQRHQ